MFRILNFICEEYSSGYYRNILPTKYCKDDLAKCGIELVSSEICNGNDLYDAYIFPRIQSDKMFGFIAELCRLGKKIIWDLDDDFPTIPNESPAAGLRVPLTMLSLKAWLNMSHVVSVSTQFLKQSTANNFGLSLDNIYVLENLVQIQDYGKFLAKPVPLQRQSKRPFKIMWSGSPSHVGDLESLEILLEHYKDNKNVLFITYGYLPQKLVDISEDRLIHVPWGKRKYYEGIITTFAPHVAIIPLADNHFNKCKSAIKYYEMSLCGAASICSDIEPYSRAIHNSVDGVLFLDNKKLVQECDYMMNTSLLFGSRDTMATSAALNVYNNYTWNNPTKLTRDWLEFYKMIPDL